MVTKTVKACYSGFRELTTRELVQYDYGQILQITNFDLPEAYEAVFSNTRTGPGKSQIGGADGVPIPDEYLTTGLPIYVKLFLHEGEDDGEAPLLITIPVIKSTYDSTDPPTPVEQSAITQAIAALNAAVQETEENVSLAAGYADEAEGYKDDSKDYSEDSEAWAVGQRSGEDVPQDDPTFLNNSKYYAEMAEQAAADSGYIQFYIDEDGYLHYVKTATVSLNFYLENGYLHVAEGV